MKIGKLVVSVLAFILLWMPIQVNAYEWIRNDVKYTFTVSNGEATITRVEILESDIIGGVDIPSKVLVEEKNGFETVWTWYPVKSVRTDLLGNVLNVGQYHCTALSIGDGIVEIGDNTFANYRRFTGVYFPASIKRVGKDAFTDCGDLSIIATTNIAAWCDIDFANAGANPLSCTSLGLAFTDWTYFINGYPVSRPIKDLVIPDGVSEIKQYTFYGHKSLESVVFPSSCTSIGTYAFYGCTNLLSLSLHDSIANVGVNAFSKCTSLQSISLGNGLTSVSSNLFQDCTSLLDVNLGANITTIGSHAFANCTSLTNVVFPSGLASIGDHAFYKCTRVGNGITGGYRGIELPNTVTNIGSDAFRECCGIYYFIIPTSVKTLGTDITKNCDNLINIIGPRRFKTYFQICNPTAFYTYNDVKVTFDANGGEVDMESMLVDLNSHIDELPVPLRWNHKFLGWFTAADGGEQVTSSTSMTKDMTLYARWEAVDYVWSYSENSDGGITITGASPKEGYMEIPSEIDGKVVTYIGSGAFYSADALTGVKIPDTVRTIGGTAFGWSGLVYALIPDSVTYIGWEAFKCCDGLKRLSSIPQDAEIDWGAFQECPKLADENGFVIINNTVYGYFGDDANVVIPDGMTSIGYGLFWGNSSVTNVVIPTSVTRIESWAFYACRQLTSVTIPKGVTIIERVTFESCSSLTNVVIPEGVTDIDEAAFARCDSLTNIVIPASVTNIGEKAFYFCKSLESVTFVGGMDNVSISPDAFDKTPWAASTFPFELIINNGSVNGYHGGVPESLSLADYAGGQLTSIGSYAFEDCDGLQSVIIPTGVVSVAGNAFRECYNLSSISLPDGLKTIGAQAFWAANLDTIYVPASVTTIGWGVFGLNYSLKTAYLPDTLRSMVEDNEVFIHCAEDLEITYYEVPMVTLTLNATGGEIEESSITVKKDCPVESLPIPTRDGYMFVGWFTAAEGGDEVTADTLASDGLTTLYAHWRELNPPANDNFADATAISGASGSIAGTTFGSSYEAADLIPDSYDEHLTSTAWYRWTAPSDGRFSFSVADADTERGWTCAIGATTGYDGDEGVWTDADVRWGSVTIDATAGNAYWIEVGSYFDGEFDFTLSWCTCPANDEYETPELLESTESGSVGGTLLGATIAENDCIWKYGDAERTVWYKWVAPFTGSVAFTATAANGRSDLLYLVATRGYDEETEEWDDCGYDHGRRVVFDVNEGETYYVSLCTWNYVVSDFTLSWQRLVPPVNDNFADAVAISGVSGRVTGTNLGATVEDGETLPYEEEGNWTFGSTATAWWKWTAPVSDSVTFRTKGSDFDTVIGIYTGNVVDALETVAANDEGDDDGSSVVTFDAVAGTTYYIAVGGYENASGDVVLSWGDGEFGEYTVTFNPAGGAFADGVETNRTLVSGEAYGELPVPTRTGYTFTGWMDEDGATVTSDTIMGDGDVTVMAQWSANCYTVAFDANGGEGTMVPQTNTYDLVSGLTSNAFMRIGHTFAGWATNESGIALFADGDVVSNLTAVANGNVKFFAVWNVNQYTLTFDAAGGSDVAPITQDYGTVVTAPSAPTRTGYTFAGWDSELPATMPAEDVTYTAQWNVNQYTLTFDAAGGSDVAPITQDYGTAVTAPSAPTKRGYTFAGWSPILPATMPVDGGSFTAQWTANNYTVTFDANGGEGTMAAQTCVYDVEQSLSECAFTRPAHEFVGWALAPGSDDVAYLDGAKVLNMTAAAGGRVTLYAVWERSTLWAPVVVDDGSLGGAEQGDEMFDGAAAETYDGYVYTEDGILKGTVQVKAAKAKLNRKTGKTVSKITVAIQLAGEKKVTAKGDLDLATVKFEATAGGRALSLAIGANGVTGRYGAYYIDGAQNKFTSKDASDKQEGAAALARWQGVYTLARRDADGWSGFSLTVAAKGKVKVQGVLVDGTKLSATSQLLVGEGGICAIPVVIAKKTNVAFNVWLTDDGVEVVGLDGEVVVGKLASLKADVQFSLDVEAFSALLGDGTYAKYLPYGLAVAQNGTKWVVAGGAKAGKVQLAKDGTVDEAKAGENPSGLKLTYKAKDGTFKGSFKAYEDVNGKPKAVTVNVTGVLVDGVGYGSATIKKVGGVPVTVE